MFCFFMSKANFSPKNNPSSIFNLAPELCCSFLSLNDLSIALEYETPEQRLIRHLFINFDLLTTCNLRNNLRVSFFLKYNYDYLKVLPLINALFEPLLHWSNCDYEKAEAGFDQFLSSISL